jgi:RNA polymerase sigma-32 factor
MPRTEKRTSIAPAAPARGRGKRAEAKPSSPAEPLPAEPIVEVDEDEADADLAAPPPEEDEGDVVDVTSGGDGSEGALVRRAGIALPEGEWVRDEGPPLVDVTSEDGDEVPVSRGDDLYTAFVRQATKVQRLSEEEERALGLRVRDHGDKNAAKKLVVHNLRLAIKMAHQYRRTWTNLMDLVQEASAGMAVAAQRWDPDQGTRFGTYAIYWIRAQLTKFLMTHGRAIHTGNTRAGRKLYFQLPRVRRKLLAEGKEATVDEIAKEVQEDPAEVARIVSRLDGREASLDAQVGQEEDGSTLGDMIAGDESGPETNAARIEVQEMLEDVMKRFVDKQLDNERDRAIWFEHLMATEPKSLVELGARYGVSKQRMGQLATRIKRAFRRHVIDELGPTTQLHWLFQND